MLIAHYHFDIDVAINLNLVIEPRKRMSTPEFKKVYNDQYNLEAMPKPTHKLFLKIDRIILSKVVDTPEKYQEKMKRFVRANKDEHEEIYSGLTKLVSLAVCFDNLKQTSPELHALTFQTYAGVVADYCDAHKAMETKSASAKSSSDEVKRPADKVKRPSDKVKNPLDEIKSLLVEIKDISNGIKDSFSAATTYFADGNQHVKFVNGQKSYVDKTLSSRVKNDKHEVIIKPFYNVDGIDLRHDVSKEFTSRRTSRIAAINDRNKLKDAIFNDQLKKDITAHNKANPGNKRVFSEEKQKTPLVRLKDIPVSFNKLSLAYTKNPHMSFNEVLQIIIDVNAITQ